LLLDAPLPGIVDVRLLDADRPKLFVITEGRDLKRDFEIVRRLVQVEDVKPNTILSYDIVPQNRAQMIPSAARSVR
jgi:hypothetical protein